MQNVRGIAQDNMNTKIKLLFLFFAISLITACNGGKLIEEYYLSDEMLKQIPFNGFESITFINYDNNKVVFTCGIRYNEIHKVTECVNCKDYYYFENDYIKIISDTINIGLSMEASPDSRFTIQFSTSETSYTCDFWNNIPLNKNNLSNTEFYFDSLIVNNTKYVDVFGDIFYQSGSSAIYPQPDSCYYTTENGIIRIRFSDDSYWNLEEIEWPD